jgi:16S rRNA G966 N2-methylase RsmD
MVHFVDKEIQAIELISYNIKKITSNTAGIGCFEIIQRDVLEYLRFCNGKKWDIIFLDPPYKIDTLVMKEIFDTIAEKKIAGEGSILIYEFFFKKDIKQETHSFRLIKESFFGDKKVIYLQPE